MFEVKHRVELHPGNDGDWAGRDALGGVSDRSEAEIGTNALNYACCYSFPSPDAALGDGDRAARCPYLYRAALFLDSISANNYHPGVNE